MYFIVQIYATDIILSSEIIWARIDGKWGQHEIGFILITITKGVGLRNNGENITSNAEKRGQAENWKSALLRLSIDQKILCDNYI